MRGLFNGDDNGIMTESDIFDHLAFFNEAEAMPTFDFDDGDTNSDAPEGDSAEKPSTDEPPKDGADDTKANADGTDTSDSDNKDADTNASPNADVNAMPDDGEPEMPSTDNTVSEEDNKEEQNKRIILYRNFDDISNSVSSFSDKIKFYRANTSIEDNNTETVDFIEDRVFNLTANLKEIIHRRFEHLDYEKAKTLFIHVKTEVELLIKLFTSISNSKTINK